MAELERVLDFKTVLFISIPMIMGAGIFLLPAVGAEKAGPASILSWTIMALISIYISMCFAELVSMYPKSGGIYEFSKQAYGRFISFIVGWIAFITGNIGISMLITGAVQVLLPYPGLEFIKIPIALSFIFVFSYIAYKGMKTSAAMLLTFAFITLTTIASIIIINLFGIRAYNYTPFFVGPTLAIFTTIFFIAETFFGWETPTFLAGETKNGAKVMPKVLIYSTVIIAIISVLLVFTSLGVINWKVLMFSSSPIADLAFFQFGNLGSDIFTLLVYLSIIGSVAGAIVSNPRLLLSMAQDKLFISQLADVHPKYKTPYKAIIFQTIFTSVLLFFIGSYETLSHILIPLLLIMYCFVMGCVIILRIKKPDVKRYFTAPFGKTGPMLIILLSIGMIVAWIATTKGSYSLFFTGIALIALGLPIYYLLQLYYNPKTIERTNNLLANFTVLTEKLFFPPWVKRNILAFLGNVSGKNVLEYGASVGTFTMRLAEEVIPKGKVYATSVSNHELEILRRRLGKEGYEHVKVLKDDKSGFNRKIGTVDSVVSIGTIGSIEGEEKVLKQINKKMRMKGRIVFLDFDKFFDVIPNIEWLSDDTKIKKIFKKAGFDVDIYRKQGLLLQYIYIYGIKVKNMR